MRPLEDIINMTSITMIVSAISHIIVRAKFAIAHEMPRFIAIKRVGKNRRHNHSPKAIRRTSSFKMFLLSYSIE